MVNSGKVQSIYTGWAKKHLDIKKGRDEATMRLSFVDGTESSVPLQMPRMRSCNWRGSAVQLKAAYDGHLPVSTMSLVNSAYTTISQWTFLIIATWESPRYIMTRLY